jgi:site-specific DNA-methyltransferase (adenine-specific)
MERLVRWYSDKGAVILDPFCGSGSTGVACVENGRAFIGIERDEKYVEIARRRIAEAAARPMLEGIK